MFARIRFRQRILLPRRVVPRPSSFFRRPLSSSSCSANVVPAGNPAPADAELESDSPPGWVPAHCPGCGAPSQRVDDALPGFYPQQMSRRQRFGGDLKIKTREKHAEDDIFRDALQRVRAEAESGAAPSSLLDELGDEAMFPHPPPPPSRLASVCMRCHTLVHHHHGPELPAYPTLDTLATLLVYSKHRLNHVYHLVDAADLPLSVVPSLRRFLSSRLPRGVMQGLTVSYIVTRADLLMPSVKAVSSLMSWIKRTIKEALPEGEKVEGHEGKIHVISVRNGWGVGVIKEEIQRRAGGVWILGAVNVGKSRFVKEMWPETGEGRPVSIAEAAEFGILPAAEGPSGTGVGARLSTPAAPALPPTVSDVPGTTAAPIRIAYKVLGRGGKVWGELIDLPGLQRWVGYGNTGLLNYVRDEKKSMVSMKSMVKHIQHTIKPGQSMILGGLIMITPKTPGVVVLATPFTTLPVHVFANEKSLKWLSHPNPESASPGLFYKPPPVPTSTLPLSGQSKPTKLRKPIEEHTKPLTAAAAAAAATSSPGPNTPGLHDPHARTSPSSSSSSTPPPTKTESTQPAWDKPIEELIPPDIPAHFSSAGVFTIASDVTLKRNPQLFGAQLEKLKYLCLGTDIVIEGVGWVELNAQLSKKNKVGDKVEVEVFTPGGKGIGQRSTMGAHMLRKELREFNRPGRREPRKRKPAKGLKKMKKRLVRHYPPTGTGNAPP